MNHNFGYPVVRAALKKIRGDGWFYNKKNFNGAAPGTGYEYSNPASDPIACLVEIRSAAFYFKQAFRWRLLAVLILMCSIPGVHAQLNKVVLANIDNGAEIIGPYIEKKIHDTVRFVGLGELQLVVCHSESIGLNTAIAAWLIQKKKFNVYVVDVPDWLVRGFNEYLIEADNRTFSQARFDAVFAKTFSNSGYFNEDFKRFAVWLKKYNSIQNTNKVSVKGVGFLMANMSRLPEMNRYFIETYIRPCNNKMADSIKVLWDKSGNSSSAASDSVIVASMVAWRKAAEEQHLIAGKELSDQMRYDVECRLLAITYSKRMEELSQTKTTGNELKMRHETVILHGLLEQKCISNLMRNKTHKIIFSSSNLSFANVYITVRDINGKELPLLANGSVYREKYKGSYVNTVTTFSDSAFVMGVKDEAAFQQITIYGDEPTKKLALKKEIYYLPEDSNELHDFTVPAINTRL